MKWTTPSFSHLLTTRIINLGNSRAAEHSLWQWPKNKFNRFSLMMATADQAIRRRSINLQAENLVVRTFILELKKPLPGTVCRPLPKSLTLLPKTMSLLPRIMRTDKILNLDTWPSHDKLSLKYYTLEINYVLPQSQTRTSASQ